MNKEYWPIIKNDLIGFSKGALIVVILGSISLAILLAVVTFFNAIGWIWIMPLVGVIYIILLIVFFIKTYFEDLPSRLRSQKFWEEDAQRRKLAGENNEDIE